MDKCHMDNVGELSHKVQMLTNKIPNNFPGYSMPALVPSLEPCSVGVITDTEFQGQSALYLSGVLV